MPTEHAAAARPGRGYSTLQLIFASCAFGACSTLWSIYNSFVPLILDEKLRDMGAIALSATTISTLVGAIMTIDNFFGLIFQPLFGRRSDRTRSRWGKRMPYVMAGVPACAALFVLTPLAARVHGLAGTLLMMAVLIAFNFIMSMWRAPCVAIMPDIVPPAYQSEGNGVVNVVSAVATVIATLSASILSALGFGQAIENGDYLSVFVFGAVMAMLLFLLAFCLVRWPDNRGEPLAAPAAAARQKKQRFAALGLAPEVRRSMVFVMCALFCISGANDGFNTYFTLYATRLLGLGAATATLVKTAGTLGAVAMAIPGGMLGRRFGRKRVMSLSLAVVLATHALMFLLPRLGGAPIVPLAGLYLINMSAIIIVIVNALPTMLALGGKERFGTFTGYYYSATFTASVVCPTVIGFLVGVTASYNTVHLFCGLGDLAAILLLAQAKHGEADDAAHS